MAKIFGLICGLLLICGSVSAQSVADNRVIKCNFFVSLRSSYSISSEELIFSIDQLKRGHAFVEAVYEYRYQTYHLVLRADYFLAAGNSEGVFISLHDDIKLGKNSGYRLPDVLDYSLAFQRANVYQSIPEFRFSVRLPNSLIADVNCFHKER